jgi:hypothetical protein
MRLARLSASRFSKVLSMCEDAATLANFGFLMEDVFDKKYASV